MGYTPTTWAAGDVVSAEKMNNLEDGVKDLSDGNIATIHQTAPVQGVVLRFAASDEIRDSADAATVITATAYAQIYSVQVPLYYPVGSTVRVKFDLQGDGGYPVTVYGRIYVNGVAAGTPRSNATSSWISFSEDVAVSPGDTVEVWVCTSVTSEVHNHSVRNIRVCCTDSIEIGNKDAAW
jgi:hypothetical protein